MGFERYVDYAMDVPMYFVYRCVCSCMRLARASLGVLCGHRRARACPRTLWFTQSTHTHTHTRTHTRGGPAPRCHALLSGVGKARCPCASCGSVHRRTCGLTIHGTKCLCGVRQGRAPSGRPWAPLRAHGCSDVPRPTQAMLCAPWAAAPPLPRGPPEHRTQHRTQDREQNTEPRKSRGPCFLPAWSPWACAAGMGGT